MSVSRDDVRSVAALARLTLTDERAAELAGQLNTILDHMEVLTKVETRVEPVAGIGAECAPLAPDRGPSVSLAHPIEAFAPSTRDGFFLVPRLSSHESDAEG